MPPVIGKVATPSGLIVAVPTIPGVSLSVVSASVKPLSRVTWVILPLDRSLIWATGLELSAPELEQALSGTATSAMAATPRATRLTILIIKIISFWSEVLTEVRAEVRNGSSMSESGALADRG